VVRRGRRPRHLLTEKLGRWITEILPSNFVSGSMIPICRGPPARFALGGTATKTSARREPAEVRQPDTRRRESNTARGSTNLSFSARRSGHRLGLRNELGREPRKRARRHDLIPQGGEEGSTDRFHGAMRPSKEAVTRSDRPGNVVSRPPRLSSVPPVTPRTRWADTGRRVRGTVTATPKPQ
jgi:hypothetical protein